MDHRKLDRPKNIINDNGPPKISTSKIRPSKNLIYENGPPEKYYK